MMKEINNLLKCINQILEYNSKEKIPKLNENMNLRDEIGLDSLDLAELTVLVENDYGVDIFEDGVVLTVGEILNKLKENVG